MRAGVERAISHCESARRPRRASTYKVKGYERFVVPYCSQLLRIFNCHINVEVVSSVRSVKYLYKYVYKGRDVANITIKDENNETIINHDEIRNYIET